MTVSFGDLTLDTDTRQIRRGAVEVHISPKAFELLTALVDARPRALSKADLHERLWPDTYVTESNLAGLVAEIRRAIGDDARTPRFVRTVQRFGYAFAGEVTLGSSTPTVAISCWLVYGDRQWTLPDGEHVLGRGTGTRRDRFRHGVSTARANPGVGGRGNHRGLAEQERHVRRR